jgi:hypothetical protein
VQIRNWLAAFVLLFPVNPINTHIGLVVFNTNVVFEIDLNAYTDATSLSQAIMRIPYLAGLTNTAL